MNLAGYKTIDYRTEFLNEDGINKLNHFVKMRKHNDIVEVKFTTMVDNFEIIKHTGLGDSNWFNHIAIEHFYLKQDVILDNNKNIISITPVQKEMTLKEIENQLKYKVVLKEDK